MTLTAPGFVADYAEWNRTAAHRFNRLMVDIRAALASRSGARDALRIEYVRKAELQERGLIHFHVLAVEWGWLPWDVLQALAWKHGFGRTEVQRPKSVDGMSAYFVKHYLAKDGLALPVGVRAIVYSQGWPIVYRERSADAVVVRRRAEWMGDHFSVESWAEIFDRLERSYGVPAVLGPTLPCRRPVRRRRLKADDWCPDTWAGP